MRKFLKVALLAATALSLILTFTAQSYAQDGPLKWRVQQGARGSAGCVRDPNGVSWTECQNQLHPGNYEFTTRTGRNGSVEVCDRNDSGPYTYTQCQDQLHDGTYSAIRAPRGSSACLPDPNSSLSWSQCEEQRISDPDSVPVGDPSEVGDEDTEGQAGENPCSGGSCPTALGNISSDPKEFASAILRLGSGIGGGLAFILMVFGAVRVLTSSGDQQKLSGGRDMIIAAIAGLLFIIFSVLILEFIGVEIIGLSA